jgi:hypothetical protein
VKKVAKKKALLKASHKGRKPTVAKKLPDVEFMSCQQACATECDTKQQLSNCKRANESLERAQGILVTAVQEQSHKLQSLSGDFQLARQVIGNAGRSAATIRNYLLNYIELATGLDQEALDSVTIRGAVPAGVPNIDGATFLRAMARISAELEGLASIEELGN